MLDLDKSIVDLKLGKNPFLAERPSLSELIKFYLKAIASDEEAGPYFLKALEDFYKSSRLTGEIENFEDFFKMASYFNRDKNSINRFFDSALGLFGPASEAKLMQIASENSDGVHDSSMRVRGSFEYSHTQTHYSILMDVFNYLAPKAGERFIDIGSGFGRVGFFIGLCFKELNYIGYEIIQERVLCSKKIKEQNNFENLRFEVQDLLSPSFKVPSSEYYFFYDPLEKKDLDQFFKKFDVSRGQKFIAFEGYDDYILSYLSQVPWLAKTKEFNDEYFSIKGAIFTVST